jgi:hypothetical protein
MRILFLAVTVAAAAAHAQGERPSPADAQAKVPPVEFRSAFEGYRPFADREMRDWRRSNDEVAKAGGHAGLRPGQGPGQQTSTPQPGKPASTQ